MKKFLSLVLLSLVLVFSTGDFCFGQEFEARVRNISGREYFPAVQDALAGAEESIDMVMYVIELPQSKSNKVQELVNALVEARQRGVEVRVILDQNVDFVNQRHESDWIERVRSYRAYRQLKDAGIEVFYDRLSQYTHAKALVIDKRKVIVGSTNWTQAALDRSVEAAVLIESPDLAQSFRQYFEKIELDKAAAETGQQGLRIPVAFMTSSNLGPEMAKRNDQRGFDVYIYLLRQGAEKGTSFNLDHDDLADYLGIAEMGRTGYRRQIIKSLRKLEREYKLITFEPQFGKESQITLLESDEGKDVFWLADEYFDFGWNRELSMRAKFCYFINLLESARSDAPPFWSKSLNRIREEFGGIGRDVISKGMDELQRKRLIETVYDDLTNTPFEKRKPKMYKLATLYDPEALRQELSRLEGEYGKKEFIQAVNYARVVREENNPQVIEDIILKARRNPLNVKKAFQIIRLKNADNPKKTYGYVVGILENWGWE